MTRWDGNASRYADRDLIRLAIAEACPGTPDKSVAYPRQFMAVRLARGPFCGFARRLAMVRGNAEAFLYASVER